MSRNVYNKTSDQAKQVALHAPYAIMVHWLKAITILNAVPRHMYVPANKIENQYAPMSPNMCKTELWILYIHIGDAHVSIRGTL